MRHEDKLAIPIADVLQFLFNFRHVLMREWLVGVKGIAALRVMGICGSLGA